MPESLDILGAAQGMEGVYIKDKIIRLQKVAQTHHDPAIRVRLEELASKTLRLAEDRHNFAHGFLWIDGFTGQHRRTYIHRRRDKNITVVTVIDDTRLPEAIKRVAFDLLELALDVRDIAMDLGGLKRWEEYYDQYLAPMLAARDRSSAR